MLVAVIAVAPARTKTFCQFDEIDLRKIEPKWFDKSENKGIFEITLFNNLRTGFLSTIDYIMLVD